MQIQIPTDRTSGTRTRATQMLTNKCVEICSAPLTTAPRRSCTCTSRVDNIQIVQHLPRESYTWSGAVVTAELSSTNYRAPPLVQGGLEISCILAVKTMKSDKNNFLLKRYEEKSKELYEEPSIEEVYILGCLTAQPLVHGNPQQGTPKVIKM